MLAKLTPQNGGMARPSSPLIPSIDRLFDEAFNVFEQPFFDVAHPQNWTVAEFAPAADVIETDNEFQVSVDLPGHDPKSLQVKLEGEMLTIQAERKQEPQAEGRSYLRSERSYGTFVRSFALPATVDGSRCDARYEHGVLTVTLPKHEDSKPKGIEVKVQS